MIHSMTAYAAFAVNEENYNINIEIRTYNSRNLDVVVRINAVYQPLEERIRSLISNRLTRGRVEIGVKIQETFENQPLYELDEQKAESFFQAFLKLKKIYQLQEDISLTHLLSSGNLLKPAEIERDMEKCYRVLEKALLPAVDSLIDMRKREGAFIGDDLKKRLDLIADAAKNIEKLAGGLPEIYRDRLKERIETLTGGVVELDAARITQEAAFMADRSDITEEIIRIKSHVNQFLEIINQEKAPGRRLNFLMQELNREFNTIGSKAANSEIAHIVVDVKSELEKMREQIQNIE